MYNETNKTSIDSGVVLGRAIETKEHLEAILPNPEKSIDYQMVTNIIKILENCLYPQHNRTGIPTYKATNLGFKGTVSDVRFPLLIGKRTIPRLAFIEMVWMLTGRTDVKWLQDHGVNYWNNWQDEMGTIGKSYGYQMVKSLKDVINGMIADPLGRRHIINLWEHSELSEMVLPPCFYSIQFVVTKKSATCYSVDIVMTSRSCDMFVGGPYDLMFAAHLLMSIIPLLTMLSAPDILFQYRDVYFNAADMHIYCNQFESILEYLDNLLTIKDQLIGVVSTRNDQSGRLPFFSQKYDEYMKYQEANPFGSPQFPNNTTFYKNFFKYLICDLPVSLDPIDYYIKVLEEYCDAVSEDPSMFSYIEIENFSTDEKLSIKDLKQIKTPVAI